MKPVGICLESLLVLVLGCLSQAAADGSQIFGKDRRVVEVTIPVELQPFDMATSPDGKTLYVTNVGAGKLTVIEANQVVRAVAIGAMPTGLAINASGDTLYLALGGENVLAVVDVKSMEVKKKIPVGNFPIGVVLPPDERFVLVTCAYDHSIHLISTATWETKTTTVGNMPYFSILSKDQKYLFTSNLGSGNVTVTQLELDRGELKGDNFHLAPHKTIPVGTNPVGLATSLDGKKLYVANYGSGTLSVISTESWAVEATLAVGTQPYWIAVHPEQGFLLVSNYSSPHVDVIYPDGKRTRVQVANSLVKIYFSPKGKRAFTTNYGGNQVAIIE
jgi:YVTN family beta-propeller protein